MKFTRGGSVLTRISSTAAVLAVALTMACGKQDAAKTPDAPQKSSTASATPTASTTVSAEPTSFAAVTAHLDPGGSIYGYFSTAQWLANLSGGVDEVRQALLKAGVVQSADRQEFESVFKTLSGVIKRSGIEGITGVGVSGIALEPGFYQTKVFVHRAPGSDGGYLFRLTGAEAHAAAELEWLPSNTAWAMFGDFDLAALWSIVNKELSSAGIDDAVKELEGLDAQVEAATGHKLSSLIGSLGGRQGLLVTLDPSRKVNIPLPNMDRPLEIPEVGLAILVEVKDDTVFDLIDGTLKQMPNVTSSENDGVRMRSMPSPLPLPMKLQPTLARWGDYLIIATSEDLVTGFVDVKGGKAPGLKAQPEFERLSKGLEMRGNQFSFVSASLGKTVQEVQKMAMAAQQNDETKAMTEVFEKVFGANKEGSFLSVAGHLKDGWMVTIRGHQDPAMLAALPAVAGTAVFAGMALPAMAKAKERAQTVSCMNNLKQVCLAAHLYATEHNDRLPSGFDEYEKYVSDAKVLSCPSDQGSAFPTYKLVKRAGSINDPNPSATVLVECPIHGNKGFVDGHVEQSKKSH